MTETMLDQVWRKFYAIVGLCDAADNVANYQTQEDRETLAGILIAIQELARQGEMLVGDAQGCTEVLARVQSLGRAGR
jgi:hypothetical protein